MPSFISCLFLSSLGYRICRYKRFLELRKQSQRPPRITLLWILFFRILSSKMTRSPPLICWKTSGRALQPSLKPRSSLFFAGEQTPRTKIKASNITSMKIVTSTDIYQIHSPRIPRSRHSGAKFSPRALQKRSRLFAMVPLANWWKTCAAASTASLGRPEWPNDRPTLRAMPSNINLHLFGVTSYKASWWGHVQCSVKRPKNKLCPIIISNNLTLNHTEIHPSVLTLLGSSCPLSLPRTEWQRVEPCEAVMGSMKAKSGSWIWHNETFHCSGTGTSSNSKVRCWSRVLSWLTDTGLHDHVKKMDHSQLKSS